MKKNIKIILIFIFALCFINTSKVFADAAITREHIKIDDLYVYEHYDNVAEGAEQKGISRAKVGIITLTIDGIKYPGYCIEFGIDIKTGNETKESLYEYFRNALSETAARNLVNKITEYSKFGYGYNSRTSKEYYLATQQLIWQAISDSGFYSSEYYAKRVESVETYVPRTKTKIANFKWVTKSEDGKVVKTIDVSNEIKAIQSSIKDYYKTPSFCSSTNKLEIEVGKTATYTDETGVLGNFEVSCDKGLECKKENNKLTVKAVGEASNQNINFTKKQTGTDAYIYRGVVGDLQYQGVVGNNGILEEVSCSFGIKSFENVQTADTQIAYIAILGLCCGIIAYIMYYTIKSVKELK